MPRHRSAAAQRILDAGAIPDLSTASPLASFQNRASFNQVTLILLLMQVVGIAVYYVMLVSTLLAERRSEEIAMLRSRGATVGQLVAMSAAEAFALGLVAASIAPFIASGAIVRAGQDRHFRVDIRRQVPALHPRADGFRVCPGWRSHRRGRGGRHPGLLRGSQRHGALPALFRAPRSATAAALLPRLRNRAARRLRAMAAQPERQRLRPRQRRRLVCRSPVSCCRPSC